MKICFPLARPFWYHATSDNYESFSRWNPYSLPNAYGPSLTDIIMPLLLNFYLITQASETCAMNVSKQPLG